MLTGISIRSWKSSFPRLAGSACIMLRGSWLTPCAIYMSMCSCVTPFIYLNSFLLLPFPMSSVSSPVEDSLASLLSSRNLLQITYLLHIQLVFFAEVSPNTKFIIFFLLASRWKRIVLESLVICTLSLTNSLSAWGEERPFLSGS